MSNQTDYVCGILLGFILGFVAALYLSVNIDNSFDFREARMQEQKESCINLGSEPLSFDKSEYTCKNGVTLTFKE